MDQPLSGAPIARLDDARRAMYHEQILASAEYEFARTGFTDAKVSAIAKTAGVSLATVYKHFTGKDQLWDALNSLRMTEFVDAVRTRTAPIDSPLEKILTGARAEVEFFAAHPHFLALHLHEGLSWGTASALIDAGRGGQREAWRTGMEMISHAAEAAIDAGEISALRPAVVASLVISALQIWLTEWIATDRALPIDKVADEVVDHLRCCLTRQPRVTPKS
ncbi:TetR/AcrR family transcriptional regulator [Mycobacterium sp. 852002-51971_SCH5477799-a]|uniref:TetR/AcrR family transcriptional regulator n=1 Tax=Mycobacterium sp. 852002-51971_SCH5477799-a TaxID=1834106 RepID=UPI000A61AA70|nr:TetR/AcrR family transcriptional regulator [Mycobacterium sp. 852002-51971_SCH5477799-a]